MSSSPFLDHVRVMLVRDLATFAREVALFPDDEALWRALPGVTNSCGNLALHVAGNLQHFVGARLGGTHYVRDRNREFSQASGTRTDVIAELERTGAIVDETLGELDAARLDEAYPDPVGGVHLNTQAFLLHLAVHVGFHLGQADYLRRTLLRDNRTAATMSLTELRAALTDGPEGA